jgi:hypothetical protein
VESDLASDRESVMVVAATVVAGCWLFLFPVKELVIVCSASSLRRCSGDIFINWFLAFDDGDPHVEVLTPPPW